MSPAINLLLLFEVPSQVPPPEQENFLLAIEEPFLLAGGENFLLAG